MLSKSSAAATISQYLVKGRRVPHNKGFAIVNYSANLSSILYFVNLHYQFWWFSKYQELTPHYAGVLSTSFKFWMQAILGLLRVFVSTRKSTSHGYELGLLFTLWFWKSSIIISWVLSEFLLTPEMQWQRLSLCTLAQPYSKEYYCICFWQGSCFWSGLFFARLCSLLVVSLLVRILYFKIATFSLS